MEKTTLSEDRLKKNPRLLSLRGRIRWQLRLEVLA